MAHAGTIVKGLRLRCSHWLREAWHAVARASRPCVSRASCPRCEDEVSSPPQDRGETPLQQAAPSCADDRSHGAPEPRWGGLGLHRFLRILLLGGLLAFLFRREVADLVHVWGTDPNWSHGFLVPLFSLYFVHRRKREILSLEHRRDPLLELLQGRRPAALGPGQTRSNYLGLLLLLLILVFHVFNVVSPAGYAYLRPVSLIAATGAVVLFLGGWRLLRCTWLPLAFLIFAVPLPRRYYVGLTLPMRHIAALVATTFLNLIPDLEATTSGAVIEIIYQGQRLEPALNVAEACSGMRLLLAFLALGVALAYLHERPRWHRVVLLLSTVPIAVLCNVIRVMVTGFLYVLVDPAYTQGLYHDLLGLAMLPLAFGFYAGLTWFMASLFVEEDEAAGPQVILRKRSRRLTDEKSEIRSTGRGPEIRNSKSEIRNKSQTEEEGRKLKTRSVRSVVSVIRISNFEFVSDFRIRISSFLQPAFLLCVAVLVLAGVGTSVAGRRLGLYLKKEPLPLRNPLSALAEDKLAPYQVTAKIPIENADILRALGTEDYIQWLLEDPREPVQSPVRKLLLFITYYRRPDRVPHVPEECYTGGGYQRLATQAVTFRLGPPDGNRDIPGRYLLFEKTTQDAAPAVPQFPVLYLFRVNGAYAGSRDEARLALNKNLFRRHAYFCKIELVFNQSSVAPSREMAAAASEELLAVLLPVLEREHWPDL